MRRTLLPTLAFYATRQALPPGEKPALFTMNILPPMMTVWYHFARKNLGDKVDITIFDSSGKLDPKEFPEAQVQKFINVYAATKSDIFLNRIAKNRKIGWICDDDMFLMSGEALEVMEREFKDPKTVSVSFRPRSWWYYDIDGKEYEPSSSYCIAFNREILCNKEKLSLGPAGGNPHPARYSRQPKRYDTYDKANEILIKKGYRCYIVPEEEREKYITGFSGMSGPVMLLYLFKTPEQTLEYYRTPPVERWSGNVLFGTLSAMLAICTIQELYTKLKGKPYPLPSLPERGQLMQILEERKQFLRPDQSIEEVEKTSQRLRQEL